MNPEAVGAAIPQSYVRSSRADEFGDEARGGTQSLKTFDPFDKVVLSKGIDNSILTSYRTLKKENNVISDTLKIVHNKFCPTALKAQYFSKEKSRLEKAFYAIPENENENHSIREVAPTSLKLTSFGSGATEYV